MSKLSLAGRYGQQNENMITNLATAYTAVLDLVQQGFTVLSVKLQGSKPIILIQNIPQCTLLKGASAVTRNGLHGREVKKVTLVKKAQVEWIERGH